MFPAALTPFCQPMLYTNRLWTQGHSLLNPDLLFHYKPHRPIRTPVSLNLSRPSPCLPKEHRQTCTRLSRAPSTMRDSDCSCGTYDLMDSAFGYQNFILTLTATRALEG